MAIRTLALAALCVMPLAAHAQDDFRYRQLRDDQDELRDRMNDMQWQQQMFQQQQYRQQNDPMRTWDPSHLD